MLAMYGTEPQHTALHGRDGQFDSWDGCPLYYRSWQACPGLEGAAVVVLHDHHEHSDYYEQLAAGLSLDDCRIYAWDARGHGRSPRPAETAASFHALVRDLDCFVEHLKRSGQVRAERLILVGQGLGAALAATWLHDYAPQLAGAVLASMPVRLTQRTSARLGLQAWTRALRPTQPVSGYLPLARILLDRSEANLRRQDPFVSRTAPIGLLRSQQQAMRRVSHRPEAIQSPVLMLSADSDQILASRALQAFYDRLGSLHKRWTSVARSGYALFHDHGRNESIRLVRQFVEEAIEQHAADMRVHFSFWPNRPTRAPRRIARPPRLMLAMSRGARIARDTGFHSGHHRDYVATNRPRGHSRLELEFDRYYLRQWSCRAQRQRCETLDELVRASLSCDTDTGRPVRILQLGGAPARNLCRIAEQFEAGRLQAVCIDPDRSAREAGRRQAGMLGLRSVRFVHGVLDDPQYLGSWPWSADLVIADGLFEACTEPALALRLLRAIKSRLQPGGSLILGNMMQHPDLDRHGPMLPGHWRARDSADLRQLLRLVHLEPVQTRVESSGLFSLIQVRQGNREA